MSNCMLDIETLGTQPGAAILSIGAVKFHANGVGAEFYCAVDLRSCLDMGLTIDPDTLMWWMGQPQEARDHIRNPIKKALSLRIALQEFAIWLGKGCRVWGNGANFDQPLLDLAYHKCRMETPWKFWDAPCYRTVRALYPNHTKVKPKIAHHALYDARAQAETLIQIAKDNPDAEIL